MGAIFTLPLTFFTGIISFFVPDALRCLKWMISYIYAYVYLGLSRKRFDLYDYEAVHKPEKIGFLVPEIETQLETPVKESLLHRNADDVFCHGVNGKHECLLVRVSRRSNQESEATVYLKLANGKTYILPEDAPQHQQPPGDLNHAFTCGGLKIHYLVPMRRWRIFFSGFLRECSDESSNGEKVVYVKFSFLWRASSDVFDSLSGISVSELAKAMSLVEWEWPVPPLKRLQEMLDFYCQAGMLMGTVKTEEMSKEYVMHLWGERVRLLGQVADMEGAEFLHVLGYTTAGKIMHVGKISIPNIVKDLHFGFIVHFNTSFYTVKKAEIRLRDSGHDEEVHDCNMEVKFTAGNRYKMKVSFHSPVPSLQRESGWYRSFDVNHVNIECGAHTEGSGLVMKGSVGKIVEKLTIPVPVPVMPKNPPLVAKFTDPLCQILDLSGGKGSSLAKLTALSEGKGISLFTVPKGIVVTTASYQEFTESHFRESVKQLEDVAYGKTPGNLQEVCERLSTVTSQRILSQRLCKSIEDCLNEVFPGNFNTLRFAVRSSATGEDTEQLSAAGQMDTFLGVKGLKEILPAVKKCWASQFKFLAVEYKRRNGQPLNSPMAVVIQEMVPCDVAGVLFTCDPVTGNPSLISITANYGLGESVVSGSVEPDTVTLRRNHRNQLHLESYDAGEKKTRIVMSGTEGTEEEFVDVSLRQSHCLSDETSLKLAKIALLVEESYWSHRDIEWGLKGSEIYLFQARPVTSVGGETDFEIIHEFDGPMRCEKEYFTVCNVGEVMPGSASPLGLDVLLKHFGHVFQIEAMTKLQPYRLPLTKYYPISMLPFYNHQMFSLHMLIDHVIQNPTSKMSQSLMAGLFGRMIDDLEIIAVGKELTADIQRQSSTPFFFIHYVLNLFFSGYHLRKTKRKFQNYSVPVDKLHTSQQLFDEMMYRCSDISDVTFCHMSATFGSSMWNTLLLSTLASSKGGFETDVYRDFAYLLATCTGVESADVPSAMQDLAVCISKEIDKEEFKAMDPEEALHFLQNSPGVASATFKAFLSRHGHRCLKEFDVHSITWGMDPKPLVKLLQGLVGNITHVTADKKDFKMSDIISRLSISLNLKSRLLLRFLLPQCRRGVREREGSKALLIKGIDGWRKVYFHMAEMMVREGKIPDSDLFFFFTLGEIQELLKAPSSRLISKANHRRRLFPMMDKYIFPEIMKGVPKPIVDDDEAPVVTEGDLIMKGLPVSQGVVKGFARVALTLQDAALLKPGEILIAYSTDIGWSPYFPVLGGVVTELGGLISHGAVVAREYGLPCVAGLHGATRQFRTGDRVLLDGNQGILQRLLNNK